MKKIMIHRSEMKKVRITIRKMNKVMKAVRVKMKIIKKLMIILMKEKASKMETVKMQTKTKT